MSTSTSTRREIKIVLWVAERQEWQSWMPLVRIRPNTSQDIVVDQLKTYISKRGAAKYSLRSIAYRVVPYRQEPSEAVEVKA